VRTHSVNIYLVVFFFSFLSKICSNKRAHQEDEKGKGLFDLKKNSARILLIILLGLSAWLRFHNLGEIKGFIFDEVYFARFAQDYLTFQECPEFMLKGGYSRNAGCYDVHPPLGKLLIALGQSLCEPTDFRLRKNFNREFPKKNVWCWRVVPAFFGSGLILIFFLLGTLLFRNEWWGLVAAAFVSLDNLLLVHSRMATLDIFLVFFILLAVLLFFLADKGKKSRRALNSAKQNGNDSNVAASFNRIKTPLLYALSGVSVGLAAGVKISGFTVLGIFAILGIWDYIWDRRKRQHRRNTTKTPTINRKRMFQMFFLWVSIGAISLFTFVLTLYLPRLIMGHVFPWDTDLWSKLFFHLSISETPAGSSPFYVWPFSGGAVVYFKNLYFNVEGSLSEAVFIIGNGNHLMWWWSLGTLMVMLAKIPAKTTRRADSKRTTNSMTLITPTAPTATTAPITKVSIHPLAVPTILSGFILFLAPWAVMSLFSDRESFLHHFLPALPFQLMAGVLGIHRLWHNTRWNKTRRWGRVSALVLMAAFLSWFIYILPVSTGQPQRPEKLAPRLYMTGVSKPPR